jgi:tetratricopeptide (TPR) repeat protein
MMVSGAHIKRLLSFLFLLSFISPCRAESVGESARELDSAHQRGVTLAREGRHDEALSVLTDLLAKYPGNYPIERDIVVITAWKGDCRATIGRHERLRDYPDHEPFYILPVSECLIEVGRVNEAVLLLDAGQKRWPNDKSLASAYVAALAKRDAMFLSEFRLEVSSNDSDQGKREWLWGARLSHKLADRTRVYARYASSRSGYDDLQTGKQNRMGVGIEHELLFNLLLTQEFSGDIHRSGQGGSLTSVVYLPNDQWRVGASRTSFAEDLPLRAKARLIEAKRTSVFTDFHTSDYRWSWNAYASRYDFSDTNRRATLFTSLGYAYEQKPLREQRMFLEYYQSDNTLANTAYFNPLRDKSLSAVHKTDFVRATRFRRHVDHLYLSIGLYDQQGFDKHGIWGVRYEQDYDFTERAALSVGVGYARRVYDGAAEFEAALNAAFRWFF